MGVRAFTVFSGFLLLLKGIKCSTPITVSQFKQGQISVPAIIKPIVTPVDTASFTPSIPTSYGLSSQQNVPPLPPIIIDGGNGRNDNFIPLLFLIYALRGRNCNYNSGCGCGCYSSNNYCYGDYYDTNYAYAGASANSNAYANGGYGSASASGNSYAGSNYPGSSSYAGSNAGAYSGNNYASANANGYAGSNGGTSIAESESIVIDENVVNNYQCPAIQTIPGANSNEVTIVLRTECLNCS